MAAARCGAAAPLEGEHEGGWCPGLCGYPCVCICVHVVACACVHMLWICPLEEFSGRGLYLSGPYAEVLPLSGRGLCLGVAFSRDWLPLERGLF